MRRLLEEGESVIELGDAGPAFPGANTICSAQMTYSPETQEAIREEYGHNFVRVVGVVVEPYDPVTMMRFRRQGVEPEMVGSG
jgi:hypothetical protein